MSKLSGSISTQTFLQVLENQLDRIESKLDFLMSRQTKSNDFRPSTSAAEGMKADGLDPEKCRVVVTQSMFDEWQQAQLKKGGSNGEEGEQGGGAEGQAETGSGEDDARADA